MVAISGSGAMSMSASARLTAAHTTAKGSMSMTPEAVISVAYSLTLAVVPFSAVFTGLSSVGLQKIGVGPLNAKRAVLRSSANVLSDKTLGVVRWGYSDPTSSSISSFIEKGWDTFRSSGKVIDYADLPDGMHLEVWVRWYIANVGYICNFS